MSNDKVDKSEKKAVDVTSSFHVLSHIREPFDEDLFKKALDEHLTALAKQFGLADYTILFLLDGQDDLSSWHSNRIYKAAAAEHKVKDILLILHSHGGSIEAGYLIGKTCKRLAKNKFVVAVPRKAKSAATLLSLGADEIHMGLMSELGPIDPQINGFPALGIKNALEIVSDLACKHPDASRMLGEYLQSKLDLRLLGYFERINESASQYAERLLTGKKLPDKTTAKALADHFVNHYKDHGFVIDFDEATDLLGGDIVKRESSEYAYANAVYETFDLVRLYMEIILSKDADLVGRAPAGLRIFGKKKESN